MRSAAFLVLFALAIFAREPFSSRDIWEWRQAADPRIRADGHWVIYVVTWNDRVSGRSRSNLWVVAHGENESRRFTEGPWRDQSPRWSPDGSRVAWISDRAGSPQIYTRGLDSRPETRIATVNIEPIALAWSPDGESIAFTARGAPPAAPAWAPPAILPRLLPVRRGAVQIFVVPAAGGTARSISTGERSYLGEPAWMPDAKSLVAARDDGRVCSLRVSDGAVKELTDAAAHVANPLPSPDGRKIAWLSTGSAARGYTVRKVLVMNADGSRERTLSGSLDRDANDPQWSSDSRTVYFLADDQGATHAWAARNDGTLRQVTSARERLRGFSLADNGSAVSVRSTAAEAGAIVMFPMDRPSAATTLASVNQPLLEQRVFASSEEIHYPSEGHTIQAWIVKPPGFDATKKYPLLLAIRDRPPRMCGADFNLRAQIFAARGFVVLCVNPRGTPGYGEEFGNLLATRNPGDDFDDLMRGVDFVLAKGYIDPRRLAIVGGHLAAWAIGHTDRFRAAVVCRPLAWVSAPWEDPEQYMKHAPILFARNFTTPTLILAAAQDPLSDELYAALEARHVESALVQMRRPRSAGERVLELDTILAWLAR